MQVSVVVPTLNRPEPLRRATASILTQQLVDGAAIELVIADNSADGNARALVEALPAWPGFSIRYVSEPRPGVATARNAGVAVASGDWIAFLDDDEEAGPGWLASLLATVRQTGADAVFGPVTARAEESRDIGPLGAFFSRRIERDAGADITDLAAYLGTNNSLFSRAALAAVPGPFEEALNRSGGEDSLLLRRLVLSGRRFAWAPEARITEWVPPRRLTWAYVHRRKFLSGQIRTFVHGMTDPPQPGRMALWMGVGLAQAALAGTGAALLWPVARPRAQRLAGTAWGGLGKVLWMKRFRPGLYGTGLVS